MAHTFPFHARPLANLPEKEPEKSVDCVQVIPSAEYMAKGPLPLEFKQPIATHRTPLYAIACTVPPPGLTILCAEEDSVQLIPSVE